MKFCNVECKYEVSLYKNLKFKNSKLFFEHPKLRIQSFEIVFGDGLRDNILN